MRQLAGVACVGGRAEDNKVSVSAREAPSQLVHACALEKELARGGSSKHGCSHVNRLSAAEVSVALSRCLAHARCRARRWVVLKNTGSVAESRETKLLAASARKRRRAGGQRREAARASSRMGGHGQLCRVELAAFELKSARRWQLPATAIFAHQKSRFSKHVLAPRACTGEGWAITHGYETAATRSCTCT